MTTIYLIRHGESEGNLSGKISGHLNVSLSERGKLQAERIADYFHGKGIEKIYSSDLKRAYDTVLPLAQRLSLNVETTPMLREIKLGIWEGMKREEIISKYGDFWEQWEYRLCMDECIDGGETRNQLGERVSRIFTEIVETNPDKTVMISSHSVAIRSILAFAMNISFSDSCKRFSSIPNASTTVLKYDNKEFSVIKAGICDYLEDLKSSRITSQQI